MHRKENEMIEEFELPNGNKVQILPDEDPLNLREYGVTLGKMICFHRRYNLGDKHSYRSEDYAGWDEMELALEKKENAVVILPLFLYDHSGITISRFSINCPWDSGQVGFILARHEDVLKEWGCKRVTKRVRDLVEQRLLAEVKEYDAYISGNYCGYVVQTPDGDEVDSCWGFVSATDAASAAKETHISIVVERHGK